MREEIIEVRIFKGFAIEVGELAPAVLSLEIAPVIEPQTIDGFFHGLGLATAIAFAQLFPEVRSGGGEKRAGGLRRQGRTEFFPRMESWYSENQTVRWITPVLWLRAVLVLEAPWRPDLFLVTGFHESANTCYQKKRKRAP